MLDTRSGLVSNRVLTIGEGERGRIWFGTEEGVAFLESGLWGAFGAQDGLLLQCLANQIALVVEIAGVLRDFRETDVARLAADWLARRSRRAGADQNGNCPA